MNRRPSSLAAAVTAALAILLLLAGCDRDESATSTAAPVDGAPAGTKASDAVASVPMPNLPIGEHGSAPSYDTIDGVVDQDEYVHRLLLGGMDVHWTNDADLLWVALSAPATGYVSVGFDPIDRKVGANYIIGYVKDGEAVVRDHVGTRGNLHDADTAVGGEDNLLASAGTEIDGRTILEFVIPLDSGDPKDRPLEPGGTYEIQVAYQLSRDDFISWHSRHGAAQFTLDPAP